MMTKLIEAFTAWKAWAETADQTEPGWQADFPGWKRLMSSAGESLMARDPEGAELAVLAECFAASEENEELLELCRPVVADCLPSLEALSNSPIASCRWQVYEALSTAGPAGEPTLRKGLRDPDLYARRRAILALAKHHPKDARALADGFLVDRDPYTRQAALELVDTVDDKAYRDTAIATLSGDPIEHVRKAADKRRA